MIERNHPDRSVEAQCRLQSISGTTFQYGPQCKTAMNSDLMLLIDKPLAGNGLPCKPLAAVSGSPVLLRPPDDLAPAERGP